MFICNGFCAIAQTLLPITPDLLPPRSRQPIDSEHHLLWADTTGTMIYENLPTVANQFATNQTKVTGFDTEIKAWWLKMEFYNNQPQPFTFYVLSGGDVWADSQFFYESVNKPSLLPAASPLVTKQLYALKGGWLTPDSLRATDDMLDALPLTLQAGERTTLFIRLATGYVQPPQENGVFLSMADAAHIKVLRQEEMMIFMIESIFFGLIFILTLYNLMLFLSIKDWAYFYYACVVATFGFSFAEDTLYALFAEGSKLLYYSVVDMLAAMALLFNVLFITKFLATRTNYPTWHRLLWLTTAIPLTKLVFLVADWLNPQHLNWYIENFFIPNAIFHLFVVFLLGIAGTQRGDKNANLLLVGGACLLFSLIVWNIHLLVVGKVLLSSWYGMGLYISPKISFIFMALWFSRHLTRQIKTLQQEVVHQQLEKEIAIRRIVEQQNQLLEQQVEQRTLEIAQQNEEISAQRDSLALQNAKISKQHEDIASSIKAAKRIQTAMLPLQDTIAEALPQHFILFRPRDVVSGDFYWFAQLPNQTVVLVAADCTGHGVPGAFMSMIGNELLNEIVKTKQTTAADQILAQLHAGVLRVLQQEETENRDGMDLALCVIPPPTIAENGQPFVQIDYAGANNPLYMVQFGEKYLSDTFEVSDKSNEKYLSDTFEVSDKSDLKEETTKISTEIKATKSPIGGIQYQNAVFNTDIIQVLLTENQPLTQENSFANNPTTQQNHWTVCKNTTFYLFSDGYQDQFGGEKNKKFMVKKLKELFTTIAHHDLATQQQLLEQNLQQWQGKNQQVDDILVIGFRVG